VVSVFLLQRRTDIRHGVSEPFWSHRRETTLELAMWLAGPERSPQHRSSRRRSGL